MKRKLMMVSMMAILSLSLFACGSKDTTSSSNGSARTNTEKEADTKNENVGTFSQLFTNNEVGVWYSCEAIDKEETPSIYVMYGDGTYLNLDTRKSKTFAELSKMTDEEIISWVEEDWNNRNEVLMYYHQHKDELRQDAENSISDSTDSDTIAMIALDDAYREISGTTSEGGEELDPDYLNSVQDQVNAEKDYIINEINTKLAEQGGIAKPRYGFSVYTDASGNNVDKETLALERENWIEISSTNKIKSGDVYDSHYSGFMANDGKYYLMRMKGDMAFAFDEIGADGISVDEDVVFE